MIQLLIVIGLVVGNGLAAFAEVYLDKKISRVVDKDGKRTAEENKILHGHQMPWRGLTILYLSIAAADSYLMIFTNFVLSAVVYWILVDGIAGVWWLKKGFFYTGGTSSVDRYFSGVKGIIFKVTLLLMGLTIHFYLNG